MTTYEDQRQDGLGSVVAQHYNKLEEKGLDARNQSRIVFMRNLNNWVKSLLIAEFLEKAKKNKRNSSDVCVLDMCCGKGGDLFKWKKGDIDYLVCADIAATSIEQCKSRYEDLGQRFQFDRSQKKFEAEFITADCTKTRIKPLYKRKDVQFDVASCQFSFHYCFESLPQVEMMLQNISECLKPGGYFIGTTPNAYEIIKRLKASPDLSFGNDVYQVTFPNKTDFPVFGCKYDFHLEGVVDCPEFLVYFPVLEKIAEKFDLKLVFKKRFDDYCKDQIEERGKRTAAQEEARKLLGKMKALETYPPFDGTDAMGKAFDDYSHADEVLRDLPPPSGYNRQNRVGTLSKAEWEAVSFYLVFAFVKTDRGTKRNHEET